MYAGEEEEDDEHPTGTSPRKAKRKGKEDATEDYQADDFVVPDESDDESGARGKKKARGHSAEADELEKMEAKMEKQAAADRKYRVDDGKKSKRPQDAEMTDDDQGAMDVESEEEEFKVRRVTSKRAITAEEEEE
jgi:RNA polymerase-associated protein LEO1